MGLIADYPGFTEWLVDRETAEEMIRANPVVNGRATTASIVEEWPNGLVTVRATYDHPPWQWPKHWA